MKIDDATLAKIANLARLEIKNEEKEGLMSTLENVLSWMEQLNEIDTDGVEPLIHMSVQSNVWREDIAQNLLSRDEALQNAPAKTDEYIKVPKVVA